MEQQYFEDKVFEQVDFTKQALPKGEYEYCSFTNCNFSNLNLGETSFMECSFTGCNFSMASLVKTAFKNVAFKGCKLLGLHFYDCSPFLFEVKFEDCFLNLSSFYKMKMNNTVFINCTMHEVDFSETQLNKAMFNNCDLKDAVFTSTNLENADFSTATNYSINPDTNRIKKARFSLPHVVGLLSRHDIIIQ